MLNPKMAIIIIHTFNGIACKDACSQIFSCTGRQVNNFFEFTY